MKIEGLKKLIKVAVKEAIQEELKEILLEAVKSNKPTLHESMVPGSVNIGNKPNNNNPSDLAQKYKDSMMGILDETAISFTSKDATPFDPTGVDPLNGALPENGLSMDQITNLMNP